MTTIGEHIQITDAAICGNLAVLTDQRQLLSQNILSQLRNLIEGTAFRLQAGTSDAEYDWQAVGLGMTFIKGKGQYRFLSRFHKFLEAVASHYTMDGDTSERLMLKYYEYLLRLRTLLRDTCGIDVLHNLELFPIDLDPSLREYHEKIAARIEVRRATTTSSGRRDRYYIHKMRPFFVHGRIYYEVTFYPAVNKTSKFDRTIAFTDIEMTDQYAATLTLEGDSIRVLDQTMPITIIRAWEVSIRPCEFDNLARLVGIATNVRTNSAEYSYLMHGLTVGAGSLLDLIELPDDRYEATKAEGTKATTNAQIFPVLDQVRRIVRSEARGHNLLRYLMVRMNNQILKPQYNWDTCWQLSSLNVQWGCIPFDTMPFCSSPIGHNPRYWDLVESLDVTDREHELLARRVRSNVERHGTLYTPEAELEAFGDLPERIATYNRKLYRTHTGRQLVQDRGHVFIRSYEDDTVAILDRLQRFTDTGIAGYTTAVERWLDSAPHGIDDEVKRDALTRLFSQSKVALIYGAAGTGKTTMVDYIAQFLNDKTKLFLANTNPAKGNLELKVTAQNSTFKTIASQKYRPSTVEYDLLVIDECSTVSNADLLEVLEKTSFKLLVLVGDVYQIESIQFGNWFSIIRSFVPSTSVFELTTPWRTKNSALLGFWDKVRGLDDDLAEVIARGGYSSVLDKSLFQPKGRDEIILCLNYDGLYGINNVNRFLQSSNPNPAIHWRVGTYKVGDPILFNETDRFWPVLYNNLKGWIVAIDLAPGEIRFDVKVDRPLTEFDLIGHDLEWVGDSTVSFSVFDYDTSDEDDDSLQTSVPFQVAYAVSIHKAQGLEYDSVKIVITDANEDDITHNIFYTAITRARQSLKVFWTPETQQAVLKSLQRAGSPKDVALLSSRRGLAPVAGGGRSH